MDSEQELITESPTREDDDTSEDEVEEDDEPALKYERIMGNVPDLFKKDSASALAVCGGVIALGTHAGFIHLLDRDGKRLKSYKPHAASILDISFDAAGEFLVTASMDGLVHIQSISFSTSVQNSENYTFDFKRPMRTVALEPNFARKSTRAFVCGGLAGILTLKEKGWLGGHSKETVLQYPNGASTAEEGPIWLTRWQGRFIAWANDRGIKIYDTQTQSRIALIDRDEGSPRGEMVRCFMEWQDNELVIGWGEFVKIIRIRERQRIPGETTNSEDSLLVEITQVLKMDGMIAGIVPYSSSMTENQRHSIISQTDALSGKVAHSPRSFLLLTHASVLSDETRRPTSSRPELRIVSRAGEEESSDMIGVSGFERWGCVDYSLARLDAPTPDKEVQSYIVLAPLDLILVRPRDAQDHVDWLVEHKQWEDAMTALEELEEEGSSTAHSVRQQYITHLISIGDFASAASLLPKLCTSDPKLWEDYIFVFTQHQQLNLIIPYVPTSNPQLESMVYELVLAHFLSHDPEALLKTIKEWPKGIYDVEAVIVAVRGEIEGNSKVEQDLTVLMECLAELYTLNRQPGKALPYFLRLKRESVFELIRENNLQTDVKDKDMVLGLVEFDWELMRSRRKGDITITAEDEELGQQSQAIRLLVDNMHSIPISHVVRALEPRPNYLFHYLDALVKKDLVLIEGWGDLLVTLYAQYAPRRLIDFLRASTDYNLEKAYSVCQERDLVTEMVFLLGQMGNNKKALTIIIERVGDVNLAIDFAKEQADDDLWEDLLKYSETRPTFIRGLLENVGSEINPIRLVRRIKNGLEIPGLKEALIKILQDFHLQISLMEGCQRILEGDELEFSKRLWKDQSSGFFLTAKTECPICRLPIQRQNATQDLVILFLCRHVVHSGCVKGGEAENLPARMDPILRGIGMGGQGGRGLSSKIAFESMVRARLEYGCPVCHERTEGTRQQMWTR